MLTFPPPKWNDPSSPFIPLPQNPSQPAAYKCNRNYQRELPQHKLGDILLELCSSLTAVVLDSSHVNATMLVKANHSIPSEKANSTLPKRRSVNYTDEIQIKECRQTLRDEICQHLCSWCLLDNQTDCSVGAALVALLISLQTIVPSHRINSGTDRSHKHETEQRYLHQSSAWFLLPLIGFIPSWFQRFSSQPPRSTLCKPESITAYDTGCLNRCAYWSSQQYFITICTVNEMSYLPDICIGLLMQ